MRKPWIPVVVVLLLAVVGWRVIGSGSDATVLFIGNDYTATNDLPKMVEDLAKANGTNLDVEVFAPTGYRLSQHASNVDVNRALSSGDYDFVIVQEYSEAPAVRDQLVSESLPALRRLDALATESDTELILFETWADRDGAALLGFRSFGSMQQAVTDGYATMSADIQSEVAPVGTTWLQAQSRTPDIALHSPDGRMPTAEGSYLAALVIAEAIVDDNLDNIAGGHVDDVVAQRLLELVS